MGVFVILAGTASASQLGEQIADWLRDHQGADGRVLDPIHGQHGTYADGFSALVFALMHERSPTKGWNRALERSLAVAVKRPAESEFDQLALLLLCQRTGRPVQPNVYSGHRLVSNNWVAMRALNFTLKSHITNNADDRKKANRLWEQVLRWQSSDGLFVDSPGGTATPLTYHAKFCAMLALALQIPNLEGADRMERALLQGLRTLVDFVTPGGALVPYGRSRHSLFGYAAAILALSLGSLQFGEDWYQPIQQMLKRLQSFGQADGHIPCILTDGEPTKRDWDVYVNNPDYNAYAAALLLLTPEVRQTEYEPPPDRLSRAGSLLSWRQGDWFVALVTEGASIPIGTPFFCDYRYYGMQPLWVELRGARVFESGAYHWGPRHTLVDPGNTPWVPYLETPRGRYCCRVYSEVSVSSSGELLLLTGKGQLDRYDSVPRWRRALASLARGPVWMYRADRLDGVEIERRLVWTPGCLQSSTLWSGSWPAGAKACAEGAHWSESHHPKEAQK